MQHDLLSELWCPWNQQYSVLSLVTGIVLRVRRPKIFCTGLVSVPSIGVFRRFSRPKNGSSPAALHRLNKRLDVSTAASAAPFALWFPGLHVTW